MLSTMLTFASTTCVALPQPLSRMTLAALTRADGGALTSFTTSTSASIASFVLSRAKAFTSAMTLRASIVSGRFGRPPGLPDWPGLKLVERAPPLAMNYLNTPDCLSVTEACLISERAPADREHAFGYYKACNATLCFSLNYHRPWKAGQHDRPYAEASL